MKFDKRQDKENSVLERLLTSCLKTLILSLKATNLIASGVIPTFCGESSSVPERDE
jgi:hypothetical protein